MLKGNRDNETWGKETKRWNRLERRREGEREEREERGKREARKEREEREEREAREEREDRLEAKERGGYWRREEKRSIFIKKLHKKSKI